MKLVSAIKTGILAAVMVLSFALVPATADAQVSAGANKARGTGVAGSLDIGSWVTTGVNFLLYAVGVIAVIMIIWGGIKYATSAGDSNKVTSAKNTILYAVIGLIVAIFAFAIVAWINTQATRP